MEDKFEEMLNSYGFTESDIVSKKEFDESFGAESTLDRSGHDE